MCCCISGEPTEDPTGRIKTFQGGQTFQKSMMWAPCASCGAFGWFCGQFIPFTCGCTQCLLRRKILDGDMTKYSCFQGYFNVCCCISAGKCGESNCPDLCAFMEGCICNCFAVSANRMYIMEKYDLSSDPCDYRLIRINNCLQVFACVCSILAIFIDELRELAWIINRIADIFYQAVSGCMTAQVAYEVDFRKHNSVPAPKTEIPVDIYDIPREAPQGRYQQGHYQPGQKPPQMQPHQPGGTGPAGGKGVERSY